MHIQPLLEIIYCLIETDSWMALNGPSNECSGVHSRVEIPVPIPNTEVKRSRADGTAVRPRESR